MDGFWGARAKQLQSGIQQSAKMIPWSRRDWHCLQKLVVLPELAQGQGGFSQSLRHAARREVGFYLHDGTRADPKDLVYAHAAAMSRQRVPWWRCPSQRGVHVDEAHWLTCARSAATASCCRARSARNADDSADSACTCCCSCEAVCSAFARAVEFPAVAS